MATSPIYPTDRPALFAIQFCRRLSDSRAAKEIGASGVALLTIIVMAEDATYYQRPVKFWRRDLAERLGMSEGTLWRLRKKCIAAGWLQYVEHGQREQASHWVSIPPEHVELASDPSIDSAHRRNELRSPAQRTARAGARPTSQEPTQEVKNPPYPPQSRGEEREPNHRSTLSSTDAATRPRPVPPAPPKVLQNAERQPGLFEEPTASATCTAGGKEVAESAKRPRAVPIARPKVPHAATTQPTLFDAVVNAIAEVTGHDRVVNERRLKRLAVKLVSANYEPQHVHFVGTHFHDLGGYSDEIRHTRKRPSLREIELFIGHARGDPPIVSVPAPRRSSRAEAKADLRQRMYASVFPNSNPTPPVPR